MAAAAAVGSAFSTSLHALKSLRSNKLQYPFDHSLLRLTPPSPLPLTSSCAIEPLISCAGLPHKLRLLKTSAAVAQEEAAAPASVEEGDADAGNQAESSSEGPVNTKLYFGNLPYNVDSAMLAGIIQDYGSPELVEVYSWAVLIVYTFLLSFLLN